MANYEQTKDPKIESPSYGVLQSDAGGAKNLTQLTTIDAPMVSVASPTPVNTNDAVSGFIQTSTLPKDLIKLSDELAKGKKEQIKAENLNQYINALNKEQETLEAQGLSVSEVNKRLQVFSYKAMAQNPNLAGFHNDIASITKGALERYNEDSILKSGDTPYIVMTDGSVKISQQYLGKRALDFAMDARYSKDPRISLINSELEKEGITPLAPNYYDEFNKRIQPYYQLKAEADDIALRANVKVQQNSLTKATREQRQDMLGKDLLALEDVQDKDIDTQVEAIFKKYEGKNVTKEQILAEINTYIANTIDVTGDRTDPQRKKFYDVYFEGRPEDINKYIMGRKDFYNKIYKDAWDERATWMDVRTKLQTSKAIDDLELRALERKEKIARLTYSAKLYDLKNSTGYHRLELASNLTKLAGDFNNLQVLNIGSKTAPEVVTLLNSIRDLYSGTPAGSAHKGDATNVAKQLIELPVLEMVGKEQGLASQRVQSYVDFFNRKDLDAVSKNELSKVKSAYIATLEFRYKVDRQGFDAWAKGLGVDAEMISKAKGLTITGNK